MEQSYMRCSESPVKTIKPRYFHEVTIEILKKCDFFGGYEEMTDAYWDAYINTFNRLILKYEEAVNQ